MWLNWLQFALMALVIVLAGAKITRYADDLSDRTGLGKGFVGTLLLGMATSLPEAITSLSAVVLFKDTDMAVGNILGSCAFNLLIVVILDFLFRIKHSKSESMSAGYLSIAMIGIVVLGMSFFTDLPSVLNLNPLVYAIIIGYFASLYLIFKAEKNSQNNNEEAPDTDENESGSLALLILKILGAGAVLVISSIYMTKVCDQLAEQTGLGGTLIGAFFMALATSLPELAVSIAAIRLGQLGMSLGNIFGSNIFNIGILALVDAFDGAAGLFSGRSADQYLISLQAIVMTIILLVGFKIRKKYNKMPLKLDSILVLTLYIAVATFLFYNTTPH